MKSIKQLIIAIGIAGASCHINAQVPDDATLKEEGTRLGIAFYTAGQAGDTNAQNAVLNEFNDILLSLKKQYQVDILTDAFNRCNVPLSTPQQDAKAYSRTLMNAKISGDSIAIEDANDIIVTVRKLYNERSIEEAAKFEFYLNAANTGGTLGLEQSTDAYNLERAQFESDSLAVNLYDYSYGYYSVKITTVEDDATTYSQMMREATTTGDQEEVNRIGKIIGYVYEHYSLERGKEDANLFNERLNELIQQDEQPATDNE